MRASAAAVARRILDRPRPAAVVVTTLLALTALGVAWFPRSIVAFILFQASVLLLYLARVPARWKAALAAATLAILIPILGSINGYYLEIVTQVGIFAALALGLNIVVGLAGLLDLGYVAFFAVGAYAWAVFGSPQANLIFGGSAFPLPGAWFFVFLLIGVGVAASAGILLGLPVLRLHGDYLAIVTLGFGEIAYILFINLDRPINITNGVNGILAVDPPTIFGFTVGSPLSLAGIEVTRTTQFYYLILFFTLAVTFFVSQIKNSHIGRAWAAIREDEVAALAMGIHTTRLKLLAFAIGASTAGVAGAVSASWSSSVFPDSFLFMESINILCMVILGGIGSIPGAIVGSALLVGIPEVLRDLRVYRLAVFSLILILMMIFRPQGILGSEQRRKELLAEREEEAEPAGAPAPAKE